MYDMILHVRQASVHHHDTHQYKIHCTTVPTFAPGCERQVLVAVKSTTITRTRNTTSTLTLGPDKDMMRASVMLLHSSGSVAEG